MPQQIRVDTVSGREVLDADRYTLEDDTYVFLAGDTVVRTVPAEDIVEEYNEAGEQTKGIATIFSRT